MKTEDIYIEIVEKLSQLKEDREALIETLNFLETKMADRNREENSENIPPKYEEAVAQITESLNNGFTCFLNPETLEIELASNSGLYGLSETEYDEQNDDMVDEFDLDYPGWDSYIRFEPFGRNDMLNMMEKYVSLLHDDNLRSQLENISDKEELVAQFDEMMQRTENSEDWNGFRKREIERYVRNQLMSGLENKLSTEDDVYSLST
ncbi:MAG: hypothetical protein LBF05_08090 [Tannerella sp.]|jgi:hypothetical protein|nr:hypothetical protein [Tannerella sp.]